MNIIDKKGKLFGKLNIIDLIAIVLIVAGGALLGMKLSGGQGIGLSGEGQPVVYTVKVNNVEEAVYQNIQEELKNGPSQLMASDQLLDVFVTKVEGTKIEETSAVVKDTDGTADGLVICEAGKYNLVFTIEGTVKDNLSSELGTQEIRVGKTHIVKTTTFELENGVILSCERPAAS